MGEAIEMLQAMKERSKERRANNREQSAQLLRDAGVVFTEHNGGAHLIVEGPGGYIDFWPGTGKWRDRNHVPLAGFGVRSLLNLINGPV